MAAPDLYHTLGAAPTAALPELRAAYTAAALAAHPDKAGGSAAAFQAVQRAWETLRDAGTRAAYDAARAQALDAAARVAALPVAEEVSLNELVAVPPGEDDGLGPGALQHACRCGDAYRLAAADVAARVDVVPCGSCSLRIRVLYPEQPPGSAEQGSAHAAADSTGAARPASAEGQCGAAGCAEARDTMR